jgi:hypothetical protein
MAGPALTEAAEGPRLVSSELKIAARNGLEYRNNQGEPALAIWTFQYSRRDTPMNQLPVDRALSIYETLANRTAIKGTRERLSKHLMKKYLEGEKDPHRLTVHGLSYLRNFDREIDSRN